MKDSTATLTSAPTITDHPINPRNAAFVPLAIILIGTTLLVMGRLCFNDFVSWDDTFTVAQNPRLDPPTLGTLEFYWLHSAARIYIPLTYTIWTLLAAIACAEPNHQAMALDPMVFHGANVLFHVLAVLVVCKILLLLRMNRFAAVCGSLVFAIHPVQVEAVAWVSGLKDVLSGFLVLCALWQYLQFAVNTRDGRRAWVCLLTAVVLLTLAMLAKPTAATVPLAAVALDHFILGRSWRAVLKSAAVLAVVVGPFVLFAAQAQAVRDPAPIWHRPLIACDALTFYLFKLVWPANLCLDYGQAPREVMRQRWIDWVWLVPSILGLSLFALRERARTVIAAAWVFIAGCLPTLGLATFATQYYSTTADHYLYLAMLGPAIIVAWVLTTFPRNVLLPRAAIAAIIVWSLLSIRQGGFWIDNFALYQHTVAVNPRSFLGYNNLGNAYSDESDFEMAASLYRKSIAANATYPLPYGNLGAALRSMHRLDESTIELQRSIALVRSLQPGLLPASVITFNLLGRDFIDMGEPQDAISPLQESLAMKSDQPEIAALLAIAEAGKARPATSQSTALPLQGEDQP
jgi:tetratricopeptide (TPR) repeat protein